MVGLVVRLSRVVLPFRLRDQRLGWVRLRVRDLRLDGGLGISRFGDGSGDLGSFGLSRDGTGGRFWSIGLATGAEHQACENGRRNYAAKNFHSHPSPTIVMLLCVEIQGQ